MLILMYLQHREMIFKLENVLAFLILGFFILLVSTNKGTFSFCSKLNFITLDQLLRKKVAIFMSQISIIRFILKY
jgi:phosphatidylglycerophosphatase A